MGTSSTFGAGNSHVKYNIKINQNPRVLREITQMCLFGWIFGEIIHIQHTEAGLAIVKLTVRRIVRV